MTQLKNVFFDLDGTLLDTQADIRDCMAQALRENGGNEEAFFRIFRIGPPLNATVTQCLPPEQANLVPGIVARFRDLYDQSGFPNTKPYAGIEALLHRLKEEGFRVFIATNKRLNPTRLIVQTLGWEELFTDVFAFDALPGQTLTKSQMLAYGLEKWGGTPSESVMVGDTPGDVQGGKEAGFLTVGVCWGYATADEVQNAKPDRLVSDSTLLERVFGEF